MADGERSTESASLATDRFTRLELIGRGSMGAVYRALDRETGRTVALKSLHRRDPDDLFRLKQEFRTLSGLAHPNLLRLYELIVGEDESYFTAEFIDGGRSLTDFLRGADSEAIRSAFRQLADGLSFFHASQKIHRDLKPNNVLVDESGRVILLDFGLITGLDSELARESHVGSFVGTFAYMSPEQTRGEVLAPASDCYSLGVMLYESLTGRSPFADATPAELLDRRRLRIAPPHTIAPGCPTDLSELAMALLSPDPAARPTAASVHVALGSQPDATSEPVASAAPFVGRLAERAQLRAALAAMRGGEQVAVALEGPSGIGKTALVARFLDELASDVLILRSRCYPHEVVPFEALDGAIDELSRYLVAQAPERVEALWPRETTALRTVFPVLGRVRAPAQRAADASATPEPHELRRQGFLALRELLGRVADRRPLVVWIDDLQWADADSEPLLRELLRLPNAPAILWLFSYRSEDRSVSPLLRAFDSLLDLVREPLRHRIEIGPLSAAECRELAGLLAPERELPGDILAKIVAESGGSPFLIDELARHGSDGAPKRPSIQVDVGELVEARVRALPDPARALLETVAVAAGPLERGAAIEAAGLQSFDPDLVPSLERARLMRTSAAAGRGALEIYHDRIREALVTRLADEARRTCHREIANALERRGGDDAHALFTHHRGAGALDRAAAWALRAGDHAAAQLAFDQAALLYRNALELDARAIDERLAWTRLGEALAYAGRGRGAADAFERAAELCAVRGDAAESVRLRCRAAEQFLVSGHVDDGIRVLKPLLTELGVAYPSTSGRALLGTLARMPQLALRYRGFLPSAGARSPAREMAIDACHTCAKGLVVVDPAQAAYFAVRSLSDSLAIGDEWRTGRALCVVGASVVPLGGPPASWARRMLRWAQEIAEATDDPYLLGMASISNAQIHFVDGRWEEMLAHCDRGRQILSERCQGIRWECDVASMGSSRALEELGRIPELHARLPHLLEEAQDLDDLYARVTFQLYSAFWRIARGQADEARREAATAVDRWGRESFQLQHLYEERVLACSDLYDGNAGAAWERIEAMWPTLLGSNLLRHPLLASDAHQLRASVALSLEDGARDRGLREAQRSARALEGLRRADARAAAGRIRATHALLRGNRDDALRLLGAALAGYEAAGMPLHAAYLRRRRGELEGGETGRSDVEKADAEMRERGIADPSRWLRVQAPALSPS